ncbi:MAG: uroporphyrinogen-III C-methyltransferase [Panacagrimonas sp.]
MTSNPVEPGSPIPGPGADGDALPGAESPGASAPAPGQKASPRRRVAVSLLLVLILLAATGISGWQWWEQRERNSRLEITHAAQVNGMEARLAALENMNGELNTRLADQSRASDRNGTEIAALQSRIGDTLALMSRISEDLSGGRTRFQLAATEHLLVLANDRLLLERDVRSALVALDAADARLARLSDPQLFPVREALAEERTALRAVPVADLASASLTLSSLIGRVPSLPLQSHAPTQFHSPDIRSSSTADRASEGWHRMLAAIKTAVSSLFTIRRENNTSAMRLLPPEAEAVVYHVLALRLEGARVALMSGNSVAMREQLRSASEWLDAQFKKDDPGALAMKAELERLQTLELSPPLPDISRSLATLRTRLDSAPAPATPR